VESSPVIPVPVATLSGDIEEAKRRVATEARPWLRAIVVIFGANRTRDHMVADGGRGKAMMRISSSL
jgi:hypothetical protein